MPEPSTCVESGTQNYWVRESVFWSLHSLKEQSQPHSDPQPPIFQAALQIAYNVLRLQWLPSAWVGECFLLPRTLSAAPKGLGFSVASRLSEDFIHQELHPC